jgi:hypothetical protein
MIEFEANQKAEETIFVVREERRDTICGYSGETGWYLFEFACDVLRYATRRLPMFLLFAFLAGRDVMLTLNCHSLCRNELEKDATIVSPQKFRRM